MPAGGAAESGLIGPLLIQQRDLNAGLDPIKLHRCRVPPDGEDLADPMELGDRPIRVGRADIDILDELNVRMPKQESLVDVEDLAFVERRVERIFFGVTNFASGTALVMTS